MGGKQKQAQRTKNNARPSSSARSAEKLGASVPAFVGFSANKDGGYTTVLPGFSSVENFEANIDPNIQIVFRKMCKKDPVTKLKALNEFTTLTKSVDDETLCATLSFWPRIYTQLSSDSNHRVREMTQAAHFAVVNKCGRSIAPYLKQLIPVWLTSQYDTYMPAKVQAKESFEKVFPQSKIPEVLAFCRSEIIDYISDNLILHTANTLSNPKLFTPEECESIYERTVVMSLQGYEYFLNNLSDEHLDWLNERQVKILDSNKFWDLSKQKSSLIRSRFYAVIGCLCRKVNKWFTPKYGKKACVLLFSELNQKDCDVLVSAWENVILMMAYIPSWWCFVDVENDVLIHIYNVLSDGGRNCAVGIGPLMLPLLVHLSVVKKDDMNNFYNTFLNSICTGLEQRSVISSKSNTNCWLIGMVECLTHVAKNYSTNEDYSQVLSQSIRFWLKTITEPKPYSSSFNFVKLNATYLGEISLLWTKESLSNNGVGADRFSHLIRIFWKNLIFILTTQIEHMKPDDTEIKKITENHIELFMGLKNAGNPKKKAVSRVKFEIEHSTNEKDLAAEKAESIENRNISQNFQHSLINATHEVCGQYLLYAKVKSVSSPILNPLFSLICEFDSLELHTCMLKALVKDSDKVVKLYSDYYEQWLKSDSMRSQAVVDLSFALMNHLNHEEQMSLLKSFNQLPLPVIKWCISRCISHPYLTLSSVLEWLQSNTVHESLIALSKLVISHGDKSHMELLKMCFVHNDLGNFLISKNTCCAIVDIFGESLLNLKSEHLNICAMFASHLASTIGTYLTNCETYVDLLISLFRLNCDAQCANDILVEDVFLEVNSSWRDGMSTLTDTHDDSFMKKSQTIIFDKLFKSDNVLEHLQTVNTLVNLSLNVVESCSNKVSNDDNSNIPQSFLFSLLNFKNDEITTVTDKIVTLSLLTDVINWKLYCSSDSTVLRKFTENNSQSSVDLSVNELVKVLSWQLFLVKIIDSIIDPKNEYQDYDLLSQSNSHHILSLLHNIALFKTLASEYKAWSWYSDFMVLYEPLIKTAIDMMNNLTDSNYEKLHDMLKQKYQNEGYYWTICLYMCERNLRISKSVTSHDSEIDHILNNLVDKLDVDNFNDLLSIEFYHNLQVLKSEGHINENDELNMKVMCVIAMRSIYLTYFKNKDNLDIHFDLNEFKSGITSPLVSLTTIIDIYYAHKEIMLYDQNIITANWDVVNCNTSIIRFLTSCVHVSAWELESHHWDFIMISLSSFIQSLDKSKAEWDSPKITLFASAVFELFCSVSKFISSILPESVSREPTKALLELLDESRDLFLPDMHQHIFEIFMFICRDCVATDKVISPISILFITSLHNMIKMFQWTYIKDKYSENATILSLEACLDIMASPSHHVLKYMANGILKGLTPLMIEADKLIGDKSNVAANSEEEPPIEIEAPLKLSVHLIEPTLVQIESCMEAILNPHKVGEDNCVLLPYTDGHSMTLGYLLMWEVLLDIAQESTAYLQHEYSEFFKNGQYVEKLLDVLFRLLPAELSGQATPHLTNYFNNPPILSYKDSIDWELIGRLACHRLLRCLQGGWLGVFVRGWWGSLPTRTSQHVERIVQTHVSPLLISSQLSGVAKKQSHLPNIEINIHTSVSEIVCIYTIEDLKMGLTIQLCKNHPLNKPRVVSSGTPLNNMTWLSMYLSHQNGSVYQAIKMWANAVQKKIESTPVCYVCYCRLHPTTGQLPKMLCQTCKNKFHNVCLYRWFSTSGKTTCPMCRNLFNV